MGRDLARQLPRALLTIFQIVTLEGWATVMYMATDAKGAAAAVLYFPLLVVCCGFFVLNLLLAVLEVNFSDARERTPPSAATVRPRRGTAVEAALAARGRGRDRAERGGDGRGRRT